MSAQSGYHREIGGCYPVAIQSLQLSTRKSGVTLRTGGITTLTLLRALGLGRALFSLLISRLSPGPPCPALHTVVTVYPGVQAGGVYTGYTQGGMVVVYPGWYIPARYQGGISLPGTMVGISLSCTMVGISLSCTMVGYSSPEHHGGLFFT